MARSQAKPASARGRWPKRSAWLLIGTASVAPFLYPLWLAGTSRRRATPQPVKPAEWPGLSVVVPAYKEREVIAAKVEDVRRNGYPGDLEVLVVTEDAPTAEAARKTADQVLESKERLGKAQAVNLGIDTASQPIVVITDADTSLETGSLVALARWFEDPHIDAVAGEKNVRGASEGPYWRFESLVKRWESRRRTTIGLVGELAALRRIRYRPIPRDVIVDDLWMALDLIEGGGVIRYEPRAIAIETGTPGATTEWARRTRTIAGLLDLLWRRKRLLIPGRSPVAVELWGHKLMRAVLGPLAHGALLVQAIFFIARSRLAAALVTSHLAALAALVRISRGAASTAVERFAARALLMQASGIGGTIRYLRGDRPATWPKDERPSASAQVFRDRIAAHRDG